MENRWLSVDEIAEYVGVSKDTIYAWLSDKGMPGHRAGHMWRFKRAEVDEWVRSGASSTKAVPAKDENSVPKDPEEANVI